MMRIVLNPSKSSLLKRTALLVSAAMVLQTAVAPLAEAQILAQFQPVSPPVSNPRSVPLSLSSPFRLPSGLGEIVHVASPRTAGRMIYHIQDVHHHLPAQVNLSQILLLLKKRAKERGKSLLVAVEGAWTPVETDSLSSYPDAVRRQKVAAAFLRNGTLLGEEYAAIVSRPGDIRVAGVEDESLYVKNWIAEEFSHQERASVLQVVRRIKKQLEQLAPHNFSPALLRLEANRKGVEEGNVSLAEHLSFLESVAPAAMASYPDLQEALRLGRIESRLDHDRIRKESDAAIQRLLRNADPAGVRRLTAQVLAVKEGRLDSAVFYQTLLEAAAGDAPALRAYIRYQRLSKRLDTDVLLDHLSEAETAAAESLIRHPVALNLVRNLRWIEQQEKFFSLSLIPREWEKQRDIRLGDFIERHSALRTFVREQNGGLGYRFSIPPFSTRTLETAVRSAREFYEAAQDRDGALARNLETLLDSHPADRFDVAFIAGGFHSEALTNRLTHDGLAVTVIRPQLDGAVQLDSQYDFLNLRPYIESRLLRSIRAHTRRPMPGLALPGVRNVVSSALANPAQSAFSGKGDVRAVPVFTHPSRAGRMMAAPVLALTDYWRGFIQGGIVAVLLSVAILTALFYFKAGPRNLKIKHLRKKLAGFTEEQENRLSSDELLTEMGKDGSLDYDKLAWAEAYAVAMGVTPVFVPDGPDIGGWRIEHTFIYIPSVFLSKRSRTILNDISSGRLFSDYETYRDGEGEDLALRDIRDRFNREGLIFNEKGFLTLYEWYADKNGAEKAGKTPQRVHDERLDDIYRSKILGRLENPEVTAAVREDEKLSKVVASQPPVDGKSKSLWLVQLVEGLFKTANDDDQPVDRRQEAKSALEIIFNYVSAGPKALDSDAVHKIRLPAQDDVLGNIEYVGNLDVDDVNPKTNKPGPEEEPYEFTQGISDNPPTRKQVRDAVQKARRHADHAIFSGDIATRYFAGGAARRLGMPVAAALITPRIALQAKKVEEGEWEGAVLDAPVDERELSKYAYPNVPMLGRYILQVLSEVVAVAKRNKWESSEGLAAQKFVIGVSEDSEEDIVRYVVDNRFFGLQAHQFIFVRQKSGPGFDLSDGKINGHIKGNVNVGPYGHGDLEYKFTFPYEGFIAVRTGHGVKKHYQPAPVHQILAAEHDVLSHHQISLLDGLSPGWPMNKDRVSIALGAMALGFDGSTEFRKDDTGEKGGMLGVLGQPVKSLIEFFGRIGVFTIEGNQVKTPWGGAVKKKLQGYTVNASVVMVKTDRLNQVIDPDNFPLPVALRVPKDENLTDKALEGDVRVTLHPDGWSYWYYNLLKFFYFIPTNKRNEIKRKGHIPLFLEAVEKQNEAGTNPVFVRAAERIQNDQPLDWSVLAPFHPSAATLAGAIFTTTSAVFGFGTVSDVVGALILIGGLVGVGVQRADRIRTIEPIPLETAGEVPEFDSRVRNLIARATAVLRFAAPDLKVYFIPGVSGRGKKDAIFIGTGVLDKESHVPFVFRAFYALLVFAHEAVHAVVPQADQKTIFGKILNDAVALPLGAAAFVFLVFSLPFGSTAPLTTEADYAARTVPFVARAQYKRTKRFYRETKTVLSTVVRSDSAPGQSVAFLSLRDVVGDKGTMRNALANFKRSLDVLPELENRGYETETSRQVHLQLLVPAELEGRLTLAVRDDLRSVAGRFGFSLSFEAEHDMPENPQTAVERFARRRISVSKDDIYYIGRPDHKGFASFKRLPARNFIESSFALYSLKFSDADDVLSSLQGIFDDVFKRRISESMTDEIFLKSLVDLMA